MWREVKRSRSGEKPPGRVALRIIHPVARDIALDRRGQLETLPGIGNRGDAVAYRQHKPGRAPRNNRADLLADGKRPQLRPGLVITEDRTRGQVDEQQGLGPLVPMRRLAHVGAQVGKYLDPHTRRADHVLPRPGKMDNPASYSTGMSATPGSPAMVPGSPAWVITRFRVITQAASDVHAGRTNPRSAGHSAAGG